MMAGDKDYTRGAELVAPMEGALNQEFDEISFEMGFNGKKHELIPVSYTHLDVYKRQVVGRRWWRSLLDRPQNSARSRKSGPSRKYAGDSERRISRCWSRCV